MVNLLAGQRTLTVLFFILALLLAVFLLIFGRGGGLIACSGTCPTGSAGGSQAGPTGPTSSASILPGDTGVSGPFSTGASGPQGPIGSSDFATGPTGEGTNIDVKGARGPTGITGPGLDPSTIGYGTVYSDGQTIVVAGTTAMIFESAGASTPLVTPTPPAGLIVNLSGNYQIQFQMVGFSGSDLEFSVLQNGVAITNPTFTVFMPMPINRPKIAALNGFVTLNALDLITVSVTSTPASFTYNYATLTIKKQF